jgi:hypothetical protein
MSSVGRSVRDVRPTEAVNNLAKRAKRCAFGLVNFRHHHVRCLLYAGKTDWALLPTIQH